jgi:hypothetical protein
METNRNFQKRNLVIIRLLKTPCNWLHDNKSFSQAPSEAKLPANPGRWELYNLSKSVNKKNSSDTRHKEVKNNLVRKIC